MSEVNPNQNSSVPPRKFHSAVLKNAWLLLLEAKKLQLFPPPSLFCILDHMFQSPDQK